MWDAMLKANFNGIENVGFYRSRSLAGSKR